MDSGTIDRDDELRDAYARQLASRELRHKLNLIICEHEIRVHQRKDLFKKEAYEKILEREQAADFEEKVRQDGVLSEELVGSFLDKLGITSDLFTFHEANAHQDLLKMDYIIEPKDSKTLRGVEVHDQKDTDIGLQFTTTTSVEKLTIKKDQIKNAKKHLDDYHVQDIVLVQIPLTDVKKLYSNWKHNKTPGGPDALWDAETKKQIVRGIFKDILHEDKIEELVKQVM